LADRALVQEIAESGDPVFAVVCRRTQHRIGDSGPEKSLELRVAAQFLDAEVEWIGLVRIDQDRGDPGASQHAAAIEPARPPPMIATSVRFIVNPGPKPHLYAPERVKKAWLGAGGRPGKGGYLYITRVKESQKWATRFARPAGCVLRFGDVAGLRETSKLQTP
jgi:hypothetical protein